MAHGRTLQPIDLLYREALERGIRYCVPSAVFSREIGCEDIEPVLRIEHRSAHTVNLCWLGERYRLEQPDAPVSDGQMRLLESIGRVLETRYAMIVDSTVAKAVDLYRGVPEDRFVSAFLDPTPYRTPRAYGLDRVAEAIEVLRISSSSTYENRRINTGVLLFGTAPDPCHALPPRPEGALQYSAELTTFRTFYRLSDGMRTLALVDGDGRMVELVDVGDWAAPFADQPLPVPSATRFEAHCRATLCGGHVCLVLTPNGEIKAFAEGVQVFNFLDGRWRLSDVAVKYRRWVDSLEQPVLAERLFRTAMNLAERRRGGLFVVLDRADDEARLVGARDRLDTPRAEGPDPRSKEQFQYLLRDKSVLDLTPTVLEAIARIDGAIVIDRRGSLLAFGAILRHRADPSADRHVAEGGRTTAAIAASRHGHVLKVSEDGQVAFYSRGRCVWEI